MSGSWVLCPEGAAHLCLPGAVSVLASLSRLQCQTDIRGLDTA